MLDDRDMGFFSVAYSEIERGQRTILPARRLETEDRGGAEALVTGAGAVNFDCEFESCCPCDRMTKLHSLVLSLGAETLLQQRHGLYD